MKKLLIFTLVTVTLVTSYLLVGYKKNEIQPDHQVRTVYYEEKNVFDQSFLDEFDEYQITKDETGSQLVANKSFEKSIFDDLDLVGLDESEEQVIVRYEIAYVEAEDTVLLTVTIEGYEDIPIIETIPGLPSLNDAGEPDVMFVSEGEYLWLSDLNESSLFNEVGWFKNIVKVVSKAVTDTAIAVVK